MSQGRILGGGTLYRGVFTRPAVYKFFVLGALTPRCRWMLPRRSSTVLDCFGGFALLIVGFGFWLNGAPVHAQTKPPTIVTSERVPAPDCSAAGTIRIIDENLERLIHFGNSRLEVFGLPLWAAYLCSPGETVGYWTGWLSPDSSTVFREMMKLSSGQYVARDAPGISGRASQAKSTAKVGDSSRTRDADLRAQRTFLAASTLVGALAGDSYGPYGYSDQATHFGGQSSPEIAGIGSAGFAPQTAAQVRQSGKAQDDQGLRSKMDGPAFLTSTTFAPDSSAAFQSGAMKLGNQYLQYVYNGQKTSLAGFESSMEFIGDELNRDAFEFRIARKIGYATINFTTMKNDHFQSDQTGIGDKNARSFNQIGIDSSVRSWSFGAALRDTDFYSGVSRRDIRAYQTLSLGELYVTQALVVPFDNAAEWREMWSALYLYGKAGKIYYWGDLVFGNGMSIKPTSFDLGLNVYALGRWELSAVAGYVLAL